MEYFNNLKHCKSFLNTYGNIDDIPIIKPMFKINSFSDIQEFINKYFISEIGNNQMFLWRCYAESSPNLELIVSLKEIKTVAKKAEMKIEIPINDKMLDFIQMQINFVKMPFELFKKYIENLPRKEKIDKYHKSKKNKKIFIYLTKENKKYKNVLYQSNNFYELVEGSKIFLTESNYDIFDKQSSYIFSRELKNNISLFYKIKVIKKYLYMNYSLFEMEYIIMGGSYLLFATGLRISRDIDIYFVQINDKKISMEPKKCGFDLGIINKHMNNYNSMKNICQTPDKYYFLFGLKANNYLLEINKRRLRYLLEESKRPLEDYLALIYYFNIEPNETIKINREKLKNMFVFKYKFIKMKNMMEYLEKSKKIILI